MSKDGEFSIGGGGLYYYLTELSEVRLTDFKESVYLTADSSI